MKRIATRKGEIRLPAFVPVTRLGTRGGVDARVQPALASVARAVLTGCTVFEQKDVVLPGVPVMVTSGSSLLLSYGAMASRRAEIGEIYFPSKRKALTPEKVLELQEEHADVAFTFDFPISFGLDPIEAERRQDLTISCALWALKWKRRADMPLFACVQGWDRQSFRKCAAAYRGLAFDGLAIGGLSTRADNMANVLSIAEAVMEEAEGKPVHVFNLGDPRMIGTLLLAGVDSVSSNAWLSLATEGRFWNNPSSKLERPTQDDKVLLSLWNLSCATGKKAAKISSEILKMEKAMTEAVSRPS